MVQVSLTTDDELTAFGRDLGTGTALPGAAGDGSALRRGDVYLHTGLGSLMVWNGAAWKQATTSGSDPAGLTANYTAILPFGFRTLYNSIQYTWNGTAFLVTGGGPGAWQLAPTTRFRGDFSPPQYRLLPILNSVEILGLCAAVTAGQVLWTMPAGYLPQNKIMIPCMAASGSTTAASQLSVDAAGAVTALTAATTWLAIKTTYPLDAIV